VAELAVLASEIEIQLMEPPQWIEKMRVKLWYRISGNDPDLGLVP